MMASPAVFYTIPRASEASGLSGAMLVELCQRMGYPMRVASVPVRHDDGETSTGSGAYIVPAEAAHRLRGIVEQASADFAEAEGKGAPQREEGGER